MTDRPAGSASGYDAVAAEFMHCRNPSIGAATVRRWARALPRGGCVLDLGCGHGAPISRVLLEEGLDLYAIDASPKRVDAFREHFPQVPVRCEPVEESDFFGRRFDGVIAWSLAAPSR